MIELVPLALVIVYLVPFMVAAARDHAWTVTLLVVNVLLGWTVVGWGLLLWWALRGEVESLDDTPKRPALRLLPGQGGAERGEHDEPRRRSSLRPV